MKKYFYHYAGTDHEVIIQDEFECGGEILVSIKQAQGEKVFFDGAKTTTPTAYLTVKKSDLIEKEIEMKNYIFIIWRGPGFYAPQWNWGAKGTQYIKVAELEADQDEVQLNCRRSRAGTPEMFESKGEFNVFAESLQPREA